MRLVVCFVDDAKQGRLHAVGFYGALIAIKKYKAWHSKPWAAGGGGSTTLRGCVVFVMKFARSLTVA